MVHRSLGGLAALALTALGGCYASHAREPAADARVEPDAAAPDARALDGGRDAGPDAYVVPVDASCLALDERSLRFCVLTPTGTIPEGEPFSLPIERSMCLCESRSCEVRVEEGRLELSLRTCDVDVACSECTFEASCELPPLPRGEYEVHIDGVLGGTVTVAPPEMVREARPACWAIPDAPDESLLCTGNVVPRPGPSELCHRALEDVGTNVRVTWTAGCAGCFDWSAGCEARRESATSILVRPRIQACDCPTCGACEPTCFPRAVTCETPPLRDGVYEVIVETAPGERVRVSTVEVRDVAVPGPVGCRGIGG